MDKYDHRKFHAKKLAKERYSSLFFFFVIVFAQLAISLWALSRNSYYAFVLFFILDFFFLLEKYSKSLFLNQIDDAFSSMESKFSVGRHFSYPMPHSSDPAGSVIWDSIRGRAMHRFRSNPRQWPFNFVPVDASDPAACAWSAAWFYSNDDLKYSPVLSPDLLKFTIEHCEYGFQHDYLSETDHENWCHDTYFHYRHDASAKDILDFLH